MKFRCDRDALADAVGTAYRAVASRTGALPVLSGVKVSLSDGQVEFTGSDLELTIRVRVPADVEGEGSAVLVARLLVDTLAKLSSDTVTVEIGDDQAKIEAGRFRSEVRTLAASDFPRLPEAEGEPVTVEAGPLAEGLRQVVPAASRDDARPILTGVLVASTGQGVRLVAHRLLPARSARSPGRHVAPGGPEGAGRCQGARRAPAPARRRLGRGVPRRAVRHVPSRLDRADRAAHRRRLPELRAARPEWVPEPAHGRSRRVRATRSSE